MQIRSPQKPQLRPPLATVVPTSLAWRNLAKRDDVRLGPYEKSTGFEIDRRDDKKRAP